MPELPEVENVRRAIAPALVGATFRACTIHRADVCEVRGAEGSLSPRHLLERAEIGAINRRGKQLAIVARDGRVLCVHLGMSGSLELVPRGRPLAPHTHVTWTLSSTPDQLLAFRDPRRFGGLWCFADQAALHEDRWNNLGPDALEVTAVHLHDASKGSARKVKALLLDQGAVAGVGNIYADEALFAARLSPHARAGKVKLSTWGELVEKLRGILLASINEGGSTIRDYRGPTGEAGRAQRLHKVYGRAGEACEGCGSRLRSGAVGQRTTVWCHKCQKV